MSQENRICDFPLGLKQNVDIQNCQIQLHLKIIVHIQNCKNLNMPYFLYLFNALFGFFWIRRGVLRAFHKPGATLLWLIVRILMPWIYKFLEFFEYWLEGVRFKILCATLPNNNRWWSTETFSDPMKLLRLKPRFKIGYACSERKRFTKPL